MHVSQYKAWSGFNGANGNNVQVERNGQKQVVNIPTFGQNLRFFLSYQINFMYLRYFMWNFCGRQNDIQGNGELTHGNWLTGIPAIDNYFYGDQDLLPDSIKNNKGHNVYYMLPLLLGLAGLFFQAGKDKKNFWVVMLLFFMTGLAIVLYLNQTPLQRRGATTHTLGHSTPSPFGLDWASFNSLSGFMRSRPAYGSDHRSLTAQPHFRAGPHG